MQVTVERTRLGMAHGERKCKTLQNDSLSFCGTLPVCTNYNLWSFFPSMMMTQEAFWRWCDSNPMRHGLEKKIEKKIRKRQLGNVNRQEAAEIRAWSNMCRRPDDVM